MDGRRLGRVLALLALLLLLIAVRTPAAHNHGHKEFINSVLVHAWAEKLGADLWQFGEYITRRQEVQDSFKTAQVETRDGNKLVVEMAADIHNMMNMKVSAVRRIMDAAENMAITNQDNYTPKEFPYYNSKEMVEPGEPTVPPEPPSEEGDPVMPPPKELILTPNPHFHNIPVNTSFSSVHIPTNVYDRAEKVIHAIKWSENLDSIFASNYQNDPLLSWQYFGSSTGFMRHYPAMKWKMEPVDLFDCRTRAWYIEAATSPKDVIVLVDSSGSMTGQRRDIARHVVSNILDTLGNNDFVNIFTFSNNVTEIVPCFADTLVQATLGNIRELKEGMEDIETTGIANFSAALTKAFLLLQDYKEENKGANCNQAIMLVSDGVPYNFKEIFEEFNWRTIPDMPVRVFTYLIGREVADVREVKWMACANRGYYVHLSTLAEVREQVLQYVPVMARPLVLWGNEHPIIWTPVYADITDPKMMDYLWEEKECEEQRERIVSYQKNKDFYATKEEQDRRYVQREKLREDQHGGLLAYQLMTSVSMPVYDKTRNANISENVLVNEAYWVTVTKETRVANLLGVAGTDIPIQEIQALMMPHQLGVNGYAFIVTNNGFILIHPDLRPVFQGILKPSYNSVDMAEVELMDDEYGPREFSAELIRFREEVLQRTNGSQWMQVKYHYDSMKRVSRIRRQYFWTPIPKSPFSLVIALPEPYGLHRISLRPEDDIHRNHVKGDDATSYFRDNNWKIHPDWLYCRHLEKTFLTPEDQLLHFLKRMVNTRWQWPLKPSPPELHSANISGKPEQQRREYLCDRTLMQAVVFDARVTNWFSQNITASKDERGKDFIQRYGITVAFMATHSGLTRWQSFAPNNDEQGLEFGELYPRAIEEVWYKRAVEQHYMESQSFVYSVPFDAFDMIDPRGPGPLVTATHAVFHTVDEQTAPAAVVGFQFHHSNLHSLFTNITSSCGDIVPCLKTCKSEELECYVVDNNGFIVVSELSKDAGRFFGEVKPNIMMQLIEEKIYKQVQITDYQAVCFKETEIPNPASNLMTPFTYLRRVFGYLMTYFVWIWHQTAIWGSSAYAYSYANEEEIVTPTEVYGKAETITESTRFPENDFQTPVSKDKEKEFERLVKINRTRPSPCDKEVYLYQLQQYPDKSQHTPYKNKSIECSRPFVVQPISGSNLILVVIEASCRLESIPPLRPISYPVPREDSLPCTRASLTLLSRYGQNTCIRHHPNESEIESCGLGSRITGLKFAHVLFASLMTMLSSLLLVPERPTLEAL